MAAAANNKPLGVRHPKVIWSRLKIKWPFLIWVLAVAAVVLLLDHAGNEGSLAGVVERVAEDVSSVEASRIEEILVQPGQRVNAGDVVARLGSLHIDVQIAEENAEINTDVMRAELDNTRVSTQYDRLIFELESQISLAEIKLKSDQAELAVLNKEIDELQKLVDQNLVERSQVIPLNAQREAKRSAVELYPQTISALKAQLEEAKTLKEETAVGLDLEAYRENLTNGSRLSALDLKKKGLTLKASSSGIVTEVRREVGEVVAQGDTILTIVNDKPARIIALIAESRARDYEVGAKYLAHGDFDPANSYEATLSNIMPEITGLTRGQVLMPARTIRGRMVYFDLPAEHGLIPGESVTLRTDRSMLMKIKERMAAGKNRKSSETTELSRKP